MAPAFNSVGDADDTEQMPHGRWSLRSHLASVRWDAQLPHTRCTAAEQISLARRDLARQRLCSRCSPAGFRRPGQCPRASGQWFSACPCRPRGPNRTGSSSWWRPGEESRLTDGYVGPARDTPDWRTGRGTLRPHDLELQSSSSRSATDLMHPDRLISLARRRSAG